MSTSHHGERGPEQDPALVKRFLDQLERRAKREYTRGRLGAQDDGTLALAVTADRDKGVVIIDFGKPVQWLGLRPEDVAGLVKLLVGKAREVATEPFTVEF